MGKRKRRLSTSLVIGISLVLLGCFLVFNHKDKEKDIDNTPENGVEQKPLEVYSKESFEISKESLVSGEENSVTGKIKNISKDNIVRIHIMYEAVDLSGAVMGVCQDNIDLLQKNNEADFAADCGDQIKNISDYRLKEIIGYKQEVYSENK